MKNDLILTGELVYDDNGNPVNAHGGGILFHDGTYYWYGEHKIAGELGNKAFVGVHVYSSGNLTNWKDCGIALDIRNNRIPELRESCIIERPKVLFCGKTGKFVLWFHYEDGDGTYHQAMCGVAVADHPAGPFRFLKKFRPDKGVWPLFGKEAFQDPDSTEQARKTIPLLGGAECPEAKGLNYVGVGFYEGQQSRDMTLFQDDDKKAYLVYSSEVNSTLHISELTDDYTDCAGRWTRAFPERWMEAPCIFKHEGKYYFIGSGCTGWAPNAARSAVADSIFGPWTELGNPAAEEGGETTYDSQNTFVLTLPDDRHLYMGDRWCPKNAIDGRYIWLPIIFENGRPVIKKKK